MADGTGNVTSGNTNQTDWTAVGAAGAQAAGGILSNILNGRQARKAREWQEKMWNLQNQYNLPVNQVARLKEAGINPNLAFGSAASTMSANIPSSPARANFDDFGIGNAARTYFQYKLEKQQVLSQIRERNAATRQQELQNDFMDAVLQDKIQASLWGFRSEAAKGRWFSEHNDNWYGQELSMKGFRNDLLQAEKSLAEARKDLTRANFNRAVQDYNHLVHKYSFEDSYYKNRLNPYETSTIAGGLRTLNAIAAGLGDFVENFDSNFSVSKEMVRRDWKDFKNFWNYEKDNFYKMFHKKKK